MASKTPEQLLNEFERSGTRSYAEARDLLETWKFLERRTHGGHSLWVHPRGITLTITMDRDLKPCYQRLVANKIRELLLFDHQF